MTPQQMEKVAQTLAAKAVAQNRRVNTKQAADEAGSGFLSKLYSSAQPYLSDPRVVGGLAGMGAGGLMGLMQPRRKMRKALTYGLLGGLGGAGLGGAWSALSKPLPEEAQAPPKKFEENPNFKKVFDSPENTTALQRIGAVFNHPISALNRVRELADDPNTYKGIQTEYVEPAAEAIGGAVDTVSGAAQNAMAQGRDYLNRNVAPVLNELPAAVAARGDQIGANFGPVLQAARNAPRAAQNAYTNYVAPTVSALNDARLYTGRQIGEVAHIANQAVNAITNPTQQTGRDLAQSIRDSARQTARGGRNMLQRGADAYLDFGRRLGEGAYGAWQGLRGR